MPTRVAKLETQARKHLPAAAFVLKSQKDATDVALQLNAAIDSVAGDSARWVAADVLKERGSVFLSPAEKVMVTRTEENVPALSWPCIDCFPSKVMFLAPQTFVRTTVVIASPCRHCRTSLMEQDFTTLSFRL